MSDTYEISRFCDGQTIVGSTCQKHLSFEPSKSPGLSSENNRELEKLGWVEATINMQHCHLCPECWAEFQAKRNAKAREVITVEEYQKRLDAHDWGYWTEDGERYTKGHQEQLELERLAAFPHLTAAYYKTFHEKTYPFFPTKKEPTGEDGK